MYILRVLFVSFLFVLNSCSCSRHTSRNVLRVGVDPAWYPLDFSKQTSYVNGFTEELLAEIARYSGLEFEWIAVNWDTLQEGLKQKKYDAILTSLEPYDFNRAKYDFSQSFLDLGPVLIIPVNAKEVELDKMGGELVGVITGDPAILILQKYPEIAVRNYSSVSELLNAVLNGEIEAAVLNRVPATSYVRDLYAGKLRIAGSYLNSAGLRMAVLKGTCAHQLKEFDNSLDRLKKKKQLNELLRKWQLE